MPYAVFCERVHAKFKAPEPLMTFSNSPDDSEETRARLTALNYALWLASSTGKVVELVQVTDKQFMSGDWPITGQIT